MASASCSSDEDYHNYETDSEDILEDSPDEYDSDYDPEKEIGESDSDSSVETLSASEGEQPSYDCLRATLTRCRVCGAEFMISAQFMIMFTFSFINKMTKICLEKST